MGKGLWLVSMLFVLVGCSTSPSSPEEALRMIIESPPLTLNPRASGDAYSQRLNELVYRGLVRLNPDLEPEADLSTSWKRSKDRKVWTFELSHTQRDHRGNLISPSNIFACMENYRAGKPLSLHRSLFPSWTKTSQHGNSIQFHLSTPDPYFLKNLNVLRYFQAKKEDGSLRAPCEEPLAGEELITNGNLRFETWNPNPLTELTLISMSPLYRSAKLLFVRDETTRALKLIRGEADLGQNTISLSKTRWFEKNWPNNVKALQRDGVNVSYLGFNLKDPILSQKKVRLAIAHAIDRDSILRDKFYGYAKRAGTFLNPKLDESYPVFIPFDPARSETLLDEAGYPKDKKTGIRFRMSFKSSPHRENVEAGMLLRTSLSQIGIELEVEPVEASAFFASLRNGNFQIYLSRWVGVSDGAILNRTLHSNSPLNRVKFSNPEMDRLIHQTSLEFSHSRRILLLHKIQKKMAHELPYLPLWYWNNVVLVRAEFAKDFSQTKLSLSGALDPLLRIAPSKNSH